MNYFPDFCLYEEREFRDVTPAESFKAWYIPQRNLLVNVPRGASHYDRLTLKKFDNILMEMGDVEEDEFKNPALIDYAYSAFRNNKIVRLSVDLNNNQIMINTYKDFDNSLFIKTIQAIKSKTGRDLRGKKVFWDVEATKEVKPFKLEQ